MKNISTHVAIAVVSLVLVIASAFLMTAPEAGMRLIGEYVTLFCGVHRFHHPRAAAGAQPRGEAREQARTRRRLTESAERTRLTACSFFVPRAGKTG